MKEKNAAIRRIVAGIERKDRLIREVAKERRQYYRNAKSELGIEPAALRAFIRERRIGKAVAGKQRRAVAGLRRIVR